MKLTYSSQLPLGISQCASCQGCSSCAFLTCLLDHLWQCFGVAASRGSGEHDAALPMKLPNTICLQAIHQQPLHTPSIEEAPSPVDTVDCVEEVAVKELAANGHLHLIEGIFEHKVAVQIIDPAEHSLYRLDLPKDPCPATNSSRGGNPSTGHASSRPRVMAAACQHSALVGVVSSALQWNAASGPG